MGEPSGQIPEGKGLAKRTIVRGHTFFAGQALTLMGIVLGPHIDTGKGLS